MGIRQIFKLGVWFALLCFANKGYAGPLTIQEAIDRLESRNPALQSYAEIIGAKKAQATHQTMIPNPKVSYMHMNDPFTGTVTMMQGEQIALKQMLPFPSKIFTQGALGGKRITLAEKKYENKRAELKRDLRVVFYQLKKLEGQINWTKQEVALLEAFEKSVAGQIAAGLGKGYQIYLSRLFLIEAQQKLIELEEQQLHYQNQLNALLVSSGETYDLDSFEEGFYSRALPTLESLVEQALKGFSKREIFQSMLDVAKVESSLAGQSSLPNFGLFGAYTFKPKNMPGNTSDQWSVGVEIEFPLWFAWKDLPKYQEKRREKLSVEHKLHQVDLDTEQLIRDLHAEFQKTKDILHLLQTEYLPLTKALNDSAQVEHAAGRITLDEYLEAMLSHIQKQKSWQALRAAYETTLAKIAYLTGTPTAYLDE